ncbi:hypothetical protein [Actinoplanes sp. NPDC026619]|uniref:hypothetical protein n=1 Tax=Actinoplanes sp. NPDC026619 TaxID=3155798 RepID=UPI0033CCE05D
METLACGHVAHADAGRMCPHLIDPTAAAGIEYVRLLTGRGLDADLCCTACDKSRQEGATVALAEVCEGCVAQYADNDRGFLTAWRGEAGIAERLEPLEPAIISTHLPAELGAVLDIAPFAGSDGRSVWLALTDSGRLMRFDADTGVCAHVATSSVPAEPDHQPWGEHPLRRRLHVAADARFAAVVNDFGHHGQVIDLATGTVTITLHGGDYHSETVPFSLAFVHHGGRTVAVHRTAWNRLDISDPATGLLLTPREPAAHRPGEPRPEHRLDYFHGALHSSPSGRRLADDGWVWSPVGMPAAWDLSRWLDTNPWESEDGPTRQILCHRDYHWNIPMCWVGDDLLAISGIGSDDIAILPGVRIFDVATGVELHTFPGPRGALFSAGRRLYAGAPDGLEIWDPFTGHRTGRLPGFVPTHHHPAAGELATFHEGRLDRWRIRTSGAGHDRSMVPGTILL